MDDTVGGDRLSPGGGTRREVPQLTVVLVGLMGTGKSSIGHRLATRLGLPFSDADSEIEAAAGRSIQEIFDEFGEQGFRDGERRVIGRLLNDPPRVLATGGGAFVDETIRENIQAKGVSVWLRADLEVLLRRVAKRDTRPLLKTGNPREIMEKLIAERYPVYGKADIVVDSGRGSHDLVVEEIMKELDQHSKERTSGAATP